MPPRSAATNALTIACRRISRSIRHGSHVTDYTRGLQVNAPLPVTLPKFAMDIVYLQRRRTFVAPTKIIVVMPGETEENPSITIDLPADEMKQAVDQGASSSETTLVRLGGPVAFANFVIRQPGAIKVRAVRDSTLIRLGSLQVVEGQQTVAPEEAAN